MAVDPGWIQQSLKVAWCLWCISAVLPGVDSAWACGKPTATDVARQTSTDHAATSSQQQRRLQVFGPIVLNGSPDIDPQTRRNAAHELIEMGIPESLSILDEALRSRKAPVVQAVLGALHSAAVPPPSLMEAVISVLPDVSPELLDTYSWVLARYDAACANRISQLALDHSAAPASRANAVYVLGALRDQQSAAALMQLIESSPLGANGRINSPSNTANLVNTACASLARMTGLDYGSDVQAWRTWWLQAKRYSQEQWLAMMAQSIGGRVAQLQQDLLAQREANQQISRDLIATYRELFPALSVEEQLRRLPVLLADKLAAVREFALNRISLLLRDSVRIPPELQQRVADRLADEAPPMRIAAVKLLEELNVDGLPTTLAARLEGERSPEVARAMLEALASRPTDSSFQATVRRLADADLSEAAARTIWRMLESGYALSSDQRAALAAAVQQANGERQIPAIARLAAFLARDGDLGRLVELLDADDMALKAAVAEGLYKRGLRQPLLDRASDETIYPFAIKALSDGPADLNSFRALVQMRPAESTRRVWNEALRRLGARVAVSQSLLIDDLLISVGNVEPETRHDLLMRMFGPGREHIAPSQLIKAAGRLAPLLIEMGHALRAYELIEGLNGDATAPELHSARFQAAAISGHYEEAASLENDPRIWIALLASVARTDPAAANAMREEIKRRYADALNDEDRRLLEGLG